MNNPLGVAARGKGVLNAARRALIISSRYGITPGKMDNTLGHFSRILDEYECGGTFPLVAAALARNRGVAEKYQSKHFEYAIHGYYHIDHKAQPLEKQVEHFSRAKQTFEAQGIAVNGFRCPYLRWNDDTITAIKHAGLLYDTSQVVAWDAAKDDETESYRRVLGFYGAVSANAHLALPRIDNGLVRIPYCVPDDEALIDRLVFDSAQAMNKPWLAILRQTYQRGELFTLGLHPERIYLCEKPLRATLEAALQLRPSVWFARLDAIARWWLDRSEAKADVRAAENGTYHIDVTGPDGLTILARGVDIRSESRDWDGVYRQLEGSRFTVQSEAKPFIGVSAKSSPYLVSFLRQQGYIVETTENDASHSVFLHKETFGYDEEKAMVESIEKSEKPLVRLGRWPHGARSALCVTGDIDALTIWDYYLRFVGR
jgi:peptidoglycan/xylan/chitin deacetylase (PgdA/CDA1 family)